MAKKQASRRTPQTSRSAQGEERRQSIIRALNRCIRKRGFSKSSLTDIAVEAGMSPSHIRYYFDGKAAILEALLEQTCRQILENIHAIDTSDPWDWFEEFATFFIGNPWITPSRLSVVMEMFGVSVHDDTLRRIKADYDLEIRRVLENFFERVGCAETLTPKDAAEVAQALEAGIKFNAVIQDTFDPEHARHIFISGIRRLTGAIGNAA
jgi:AcrR family transcriptional regulator